MHARQATCHLHNLQLEPKATDHIGDMVATIETIIANGHAYAVDGDVYFDVPSLPSYGQLSGRSQVGGNCNTSCSAFGCVCCSRCGSILVNAALHKQ